MSLFNIVGTITDAVLYAACGKTTMFVLEIELRMSNNVRNFFNWLFIQKHSFI